jgi:hypothetical protein
VELLQSWYLTSTETVLSQRAAFAIAHFAARPDAARNNTNHSDGHVHGIKVLSWLLGLGAGSTTSPVVPTCGIPASAFAAELVMVVSRAVGRQKASQQLAASQDMPVLQLLMQEWQATTVVLGGVQSAWTVMQRVAGVEVRTVDQWRSLAAWAVQQHQLMKLQQHQLVSDDHHGTADVLSEHAKQLQAVLGTAWSTIVWISSNQADICNMLG